MNLQNTQELKSLAREHLGNQELAKAQSVLRQVCKKHQNDAEAWYLPGCVESAMNHPGQAIRCYENVTRLDPSSAAAHFHLAIARISLDQHSMALNNMENCLA